jgi:glycopeptide antibiotics resistance protein
MFHIFGFHKVTKSVSKTKGIKRIKIKLAKMLYNQRKTIQIIFIIYCSILVLVSAIPWGGKFNSERIDMGQFNLRLDYLLHSCAFLGFYILLWFISISKLSVPSSLFRKVFILSIILSIVTEVIQLLIPYRTFNPLDLISNLSGIILGAACFLAYKYLYRKSSA